MIDLLKNKLVTYKSLKIGQIILGIETSNSSRSFKAYVKAINPNFVTVALWRENGTEENINSSVMFKVEMSKEEFNNKYKDKAKEIIKNIQNKLLYDEIGYHEMWNSWLYGTPYEMAAYCEKEKIKIIGHSTDITPKTTMFSKDTLDIGVCAEYEDGKRFWCHYSSSNIEQLKKYLELQEKRQDRKET